MPARRHRLDLSHLRGVLDTGASASIRAGPISPFVVFRLGSGRTQTKALRDPGPRPRWSSSYHINDIDPDTTPDLEAFLYDSGNGDPILIGTGVARLPGSHPAAVRINLVDDRATHIGHLEVEVDPHGLPFRTTGTGGPRIVAATPHAEVVIAEPTPAPPPPASQGYIPCKEFVTTRPGDKEPVCGRQEYSVTEDRPIEKERRTTILEHHLYEKTFVVETRLVGERPLPGDPRPETISVRECVTRECQPEQCVGAPQLTVETC
ncbi:g12833 [Coccomyxa viridis]|uniref:G12833 protein n=1 Tax=Coccomyxa viridis TaxID=1274662 RepID=A0ABP1GBM9_9CHLO